GEDPGPSFLELGWVARAEDRRRAGLGEADRGGEADSRRAAGDEHDLAADRAAQRPVDLQRGVEVALPVVPQPPRIVGERRALDSRTLQRRERFAAVVAGREVDEG